MQKKMLYLVFTFVLVFSVFGVKAVLAQEPTPSDEPILLEEAEGNEDFIDWFTVAAETIGVDEEALWTGLDEGKTIKDVAAANNVDQSSCRYAAGSFMTARSLYKSTAPLNPSLFQVVPAGSSTSGSAPGNGYAVT